MNPNIKRLIEDSGFYIVYENKEVTDKELEALIQLAIKECLSEAGRHEFIDVAIYEVRDKFGIN